MANTKMYAYLNSKILVRFFGLHKLTHRLTFGIIYFCEYYTQKSFILLVS